MKILAEQLWSNVVGTPFKPLELATLIHRDGGYDFHKISIDDIVKLMDGKYEGDWGKIGFSFSEVLSYYKVISQKLEAEQIVAWIISFLILSEAIRHGCNDWSYQFNIFADLFLTCRNRVESDMWIEIFEELFRKL